jgi:hypothetical protein
MTMHTKMVVQTIDRVNRYLRCKAGNADFDVKYDGEPPWPLSFIRAKDVQGGTWEWSNTIGHCRRLYRDDFLSVDAAAGKYGDTDWNWQFASFTIVSPGAAGSGSVRLDVAPNAGQFGNLYKNLDTLREDNIYWMYTRIAPGSAISNRFDFVGFGDNVNRHVGVYYDTSLGGNFQLSTQNGGGANRVDSGKPMISLGWSEVDVVVKPGQWAGLWVDGAGPTLTSTAVPSFASTPVGTQISSTTTDGVAKFLYCDVNEVSLVAPVADPYTDI